MPSGLPSPPHRPALRPKPGHRGPPTLFINGHPHNGMAWATYGYTGPGDVVWATKDLVSVCVHHAGPRTITLPRSATVTDLYSGAPVGDNLRSFQAEFSDRATSVFVLQ